MYDILVFLWSTKFCRIFVRTLSYNSSLEILPNHYLLYKNWLQLSIWCFMYMNSQRVTTTGYVDDRKGRVSNAECSVLSLNIGSVLELLLSVV